MTEILDMVLIMTDDQLEHLDKFADQVSQVVLIDEIGKYELGMFSGYSAVQLSIMASMRDKKEVIRFLAAGLKYICMRVEGSPFIYFPCEGDVTDLWFDFYDKPGVLSFFKDMLTIKERYEMIFEANSYWVKHTMLSLLYNDELDDESVLIELSDQTPELFTAEDELTIIHEFTGEAHNVDLTLGIKEDYFTIMVLKKLENTDKNIL